LFCTCGNQAAEMDKYISRNAKKHFYCFIWYNSASLSKRFFLQNLSKEKDRAEKAEIRQTKAENA